MAPSRGSRLLVAGSRHFDDAALVGTRRAHPDSYWALRALGLAALLGAAGLVPSGLVWCVEAAIRVVR